MNFGFGDAITLIENQAVLDLMTEYFLFVSLAFPHAKL